MKFIKLDNYIKDREVVEVFKLEVDEVFSRIPKIKQESVLGIYGNKEKLFILKSPFVRGEDFIVCKAIEMTLTENSRDIEKFVRVCFTKHYKNFYFKGKNIDDDEIFVNIDDFSKFEEINDAESKDIYETFSEFYSRGNTFKKF